MSELSTAMFGTAAMAEVFSDAARVRRMLEAEAALARAQAAVGIVPADAAEAIARACETAELDVGGLHRDAARAGTLAIPLVAQLTELVPEDARGWVHRGATSQDIVDTATVLQVRDGLGALIEHVEGLGDACAAHARAHRDTPMVARTLLQHAAPTTFGLTAARWLTALARRLPRLRELSSALPAQLGGPTGGLGTLDDRGVAVLDRFAAELGLAAPPVPWHTDRGPLAEVAGELQLVASAAAKIAYDVVLLSQSDVAEVAESHPAGEGGSSSMPQKRNPVDAVMARAAARLADAACGVVLRTAEHELERAAGAWQAEWVALPAAFLHTDGAVDRVRASVAGLEVDPGRMRANLAADHGAVLASHLSTALAAQLGRGAAHDLVTQLVARARGENRSLAEVAKGDATVMGVLSPEEIEAALDPAAGLANAGALVDRALNGWHAVRD